jgi:hypothetical protein
LRTQAKKRAHEEWVASPARKASGAAKEWTDRARSGWDGYMQSAWDNWIATRQVR